MRYTEIKENIKELSNRLVTLISDCETLDFTTGKLSQDWKKVCYEILQQLDEDILRMAVVGAIKSGKSTFTNFLFQGDYLKRGAGIVTSFVTKVRRGNILKATIELKSWKEINAEIERAINGISIYEQKFKSILPFNINDSSKRRDLEEIINTINLDSLIINGVHDINYMTLALYLRGYDNVVNLISDKRRVLIYKGKNFEKYKTFVSNDDFAIYLNNVIIEINEGIFDNSIELADCQGSDSPNPIHMIMIQEYLAVSQLVIYVISSRTGIREADIRFLHMLKDMGLINQVLFIINCDFDEHHSLQDLRTLIKKVEEQILLFYNKPNIFTFSALFNLLSEIDKAKKELSQKERIRLYQWKHDIELVRFSEQETNKFLEYVNRSLLEKKNIVSIKSWAERLYYISSQIIKWISINIDFIQGNTVENQEFIKRLHENKKKVEQLRSVIMNALDGTCDRIKDEIKRSIDKFFDKNGELLVGLKHFINGFQFPYNKCVTLLKEQKLSYAQYMVFMEYKNSVDFFITHNINPLIIKFIRDLSNKIQDEFISMILPYYEISASTIAEFIKTQNSIFLNNNLLDLDYIKKIYSIKMPSIGVVLEYDPLIGTEAIVRFGFYKIFSAITRIFKKSDHDPISEKIKALEEGLLKIKRQSLNFLTFQLINYKENLKYQYFFAIIDACKKYILDRVDEYFKNSIEGFLDSEKRIKQEQFDKKDILENLSRIKEEVIHIKSHIEKLGDLGNFIHLLK